MSQTLLARILPLSKFKCIASIYKRKSFISLALFNFSSCSHLCSRWRERIPSTNTCSYGKVKLRKGIESCKERKEKKGKKKRTASTKSRIHFTSRENSSDCNLECDVFPIASESCSISMQSHFGSLRAEGGD